MFLKEVQLIRAEFRFIFGANVKNFWKMFLILFFDLKLVQKSTRCDYFKVFCWGVLAKPKPYFSENKSMLLCMVQLKGKQQVGINRVNAKSSFWASLQAFLLSFLEVFISAANDLKLK